MKYDYIIIGSGFGGSVAALRLSEKGYKVLVIEKGKWFDGKDFPKTNWNFKKWLWIPSLHFFGIMKLSIFRHIAILSGTGVGGYKLFAQGTTPLITSNGQFGKGESRWFKTASSLSVENINGLTELAVYPNPAKEVAKLNFSLEKASNLTIAVYDQLGQLVQVVSNSQFNAGVNQVEIYTSSLNSGIYNIRIDAESGSLSQRISVIK